MQMAGGIVHDHGPERVHRHVGRNVERIGRRAVVLDRCDIELDRVPVGIAAPGQGGRNEVPDGIDLVLAATSFP